MFEDLEARIKLMIYRRSYSSVADVYEEVNRAYEDCDIDDEQYHILCSMLINIDRRRIVSC